MMLVTIPKVSDTYSKAPNHSSMNFPKVNTLTWPALRLEKRTLPDHSRSPQLLGDMHLKTKQPTSGLRG